MTTFCSFCGKRREDVWWIIIGKPDMRSTVTPAICDECVDVCNETIALKKAEASQPTPHMESK